MMGWILLLLFAIYAAMLCVAAIKVNADLEEERDCYPDGECELCPDETCDDRNRTTDEKKKELTKLEPGEMILGMHVLEEALARAPVSVEYLSESMNALSHDLNAMRDGLNVGRMIYDEYHEYIYPRGHYIVVDGYEGVRQRYMQKFSRDSNNYRKMHGGRTVRTAWRKRLWLR